MKAFHAGTSEVLTDLSRLATQFDAHGSSLAEAVAQIDGATGAPRTCSPTGARRSIRGQRRSTATATSTSGSSASRACSTRRSRRQDRARDIARVVAESTPKAPASPNWNVRPRQRGARTASTRAHTGETAEMFRRPASASRDRAQMNEMSAAMQREMETTRTELRRGILELPQETAESAAQMRRVIVEQIDALAELNRIVARHGRGVDAAEPARRAPSRADGSGRRAAQRSAVRHGRPAAPERAPRPAPMSPAPRRSEPRRAAAEPQPRPRRKARAAAGSPTCSRASSREEAARRRRATARPRHAHRVARLALGRYRAHDRS